MTRDGKGKTVEIAGCQGKGAAGVRGVVHTRSAQRGRACACKLAGAVRDPRLVMCSKAHANSQAAGAMPRSASHHMLDLRVDEWTSEP